MITLPISSSRQTEFLDITREVEEMIINAQVPVGSSVSVMIENGLLILGRWQSLFFCEFDGPRTRKVLIIIIPQ